MTGRLFHYRAEPLGDLYDVEQTGEPDHKPVGLWVSAGDGEDSWPAWCRAESFGLAHLACRTEFRLADGARVLTLRGAKAIDTFNAEFGRNYSFRDRPQAGQRRDVVDWRAVAQRYHGIIIAPYVWSRRLDGPARWYYGWDCASGCIWRPTKALIRVDSPTISEAA